MARIFIADNREHADPDPSMSVEQVRETMAAFYPELHNAVAKESKRGDDTIIDFIRQIGTKG